MSKSIVLLNGLPGSGKTTLAAPLGRELAMPVISKDAIKEALADVIAVPLPTSRLGALASDAMWQLAAMIDGPVVVESFWAAGRDDGFLQSGLAVAGAQRAIEVWCDVPIDVARERFVTRPRHAAHRDAERLGEWDEIAARARPCSGRPTITVLTSTPVDVPLLANRVRTLLDEPASGLVRE